MIRLTMLISGILLLMAVCGWGAPLCGKVTLAGKGVAGVSVAAWPKGVLSFDGEPGFRSDPSAGDGRFSLDLPAGQYFLIAEGQELFSYYGRNPVAVTADGVDNITLPMTRLPALPSGVAAGIEEGVLGRVTREGEPAAGAVVFVYPDLSSELKGFGLGMAAPTGADGVFELNLSPGTYYLVARVRLGGGFAGPLNAGDLFGYAPLNPLVVAAGKVARVAIPLIEVPEKVSQLASVMFGNTRIVGRVVDVVGKPVSGIKVLLYTDPSMLDRPLYVSQPTGEDGRFVLSFPEGGTYYLAARDTLGGTPAPGELYGRYQGSADHALRIESGKELKDVEIVVEEVW